MFTKKIFLLGLSAFLVAGGTFAASAALKEKKESAPEVKAESAVSALPLETAKGDDLAQLSDAAASWAGEVISPTTLEAHPQSEGTIIQLSVRVGQSVSSGQVIARLSPPPASVDRAMAASSKMEAIIKARANVTATDRLVKKTREGLLESRKSLLPARDTETAARKRRSTECST